MILTEGRGLFARSAGDVFVNQELDIKASFVKVTPYPDVAAGGKFDSPEQRDAAVNQIQNELGIIDWVNLSKSNMLAFAVAELELEDGSSIYWGRYFTEIKPVMTTAWPSANMPSGWRLGVAAAEKMQLGYDPQTLIKDERAYTMDGAIKQVMKNAPTGATGEQLIAALNELKAGRLPTFTDMATEIPAIRDYFGEIMGPIALIAGLIEGQAEDARNELIPGVEWRECRIMWPQASTYELVDSFMIAPDGTRVGISSKGNKGAKASAKNIQTAIDKAKQEQPAIVKRNPITVKIMKTITENSALDGPLVLAKETGMIDDKMIDRIKSFISEGKKDFAGLTKTELKLINQTNHRTDNPDFNVGYALLSVIAKQVAEGINKDGKFSKGAKEFLNQSSIIQLHMYMNKSGNDGIVNRFESIFPPNFEGDIYLDPSKNYMSTRVHGKLTFAFKKKSG
jgi:hypothetical protein